ncbi:hypothetical protein [Streptomyces sp. 1268]|uniref:hypothetical protein n=1 Tax=Streptomyces sp. 1268 TaxID=3231942 RepID=UPI0038D4E5D0
MAFPEGRKIGTRRLFGGNLTRDPACIGCDFRISGDMENDDIITENAFWVGVCPGLSLEKIDYVARSVREFVLDDGGSGG